LSARTLISDSPGRRFADGCVLWIVSMTFVLEIGERRDNDGFEGRAIEDALREVCEPIDNSPFASKMGPIFNG
jgi:hypothetical protein